MPPWWEMSLNFSFIFLFIFQLKSRIYFPLSEANYPNNLSKCGTNVGYNCSHKTTIRGVWHSASWFVIWAVVESVCTRWTAIGRNAVWQQPIIHVCHNLLYSSIYCLQLRGRLPARARINAADSPDLMCSSRDSVCDDCRFLPESLERQAGGGIWHKGVWACAEERKILYFLSWWTLLRTPVEYFNPR